MKIQNLFYTDANKLYGWVSIKSLAYDAFKFDKIVNL